MFQIQYDVFRKKIIPFEAVNRKNGGVKKHKVNGTKIKYKRIRINTLDDNEKEAILVLLALVVYSFRMGPLQPMITWYRIHHAGEQATHWDIQNKENANLS